MKHPLVPELVAALLARDFPAYDWSRDPLTGAFAGQAHNVATRPWCVVSRDVNEIRAALAVQP